MGGWVGGGGGRALCCPLTPHGHHHEMASSEILSNSHGFQPSAQSATQATPLRAATSRKRHKRQATAVCPCIITRYCLANWIGSISISSCGSISEILGLPPAIPPLNAKTQLKTPPIKPPPKRTPCRLNSAISANLAARPSQPMCCRRRSCRRTQCAATIVWLQCIQASGSVHTRIM